MKTDKHLRNGTVLLEAVLLDGVECDFQLSDKLSIADHDRHGLLSSDIAFWGFFGQKKQVSKDTGRCSNLEPLEEKKKTKT